MALGPGGEPFAAVHETHIGVVFLVGERAYKLKKPVTTGFLDFGSREKRLAACRREVQLNRRLAPDVYLGVADVTGPDGGCTDHLVVMRRMPEAARLSTLVRRGDRLNEEVRAIARLIAAFHARATRGPEISAQGSRDALRTRWTDSFDQVRRFRGVVLDETVQASIERLTLRFLAGREPLFAARIVEGRILDEVTRSELVELRCCAPDAVATARIASRGHPPSDATAEIAQAMAADADPWPRAVEVSTIGTTVRAAEIAVTAWEATPPAHHRVSDETGPAF